MTSASDPMATHGDEAPLGERLDSWKGIASHFGRDVTTVQRWEKHEGLPVHRHLHRKRGSVHAFTRELDAWWGSRRAAGEPLDRPARAVPRALIVGAIAGTLLLALVIGVAGGFIDLGKVQERSSADTSASPVPTDTRLVELLDRGRLHRDQFTPDGVRKALDAFDEAVRIAPESAAAHAGLAITHVWAIPRSAEYPRVHGEKARIAADRAMALGPSLADSQTALAMVRAFQRDWAGATEAYRRAIAISPNDAQLRAWYALSLATQGRFPEALEEIRTARRLNPISQQIQSQAGWMYFWAGQVDDAMEQWRQALQTDPNFALGHYDMGLGFMRLGLYRRAIAEFERALALVPGRVVYLTQLAAARARNGDRREAERLLRALEERATREYVPGNQLAEVYAALGRTNEAMRVLERADDERDVQIPRLRFHAYKYSPLDKTERFQALVRKVTPPAPGR